MTPSGPRPLSMPCTPASTSRATTADSSRSASSPRSFPVMFRFDPKGVEWPNTPSRAVLTEAAEHAHGGRVGPWPGARTRADRSAPTADGAPDTPPRASTGSTRPRGSPPCRAGGTFSCANRSRNPAGSAACASRMLYVLGLYGDAYGLDRPSRSARGSRRSTRWRQSDRGRCQSSGRGRSTLTECRILLGLVCGCIRSGSATRSGKLPRNERRSGARPLRRSCESLLRATSLNSRAHRRQGKRETAGCR